MAHVMNISETEYKRRVKAWTMYDWANSAFATTILAAVLPVYYSQVAGANLPSEAVATAYWSLGLSLSLFLIAIISPILGTISDIKRGKKKFLAFFAGFGIIAVGLMVLVDTGDFILASILFLVGRIGFTGANVFYDALLPHVAKEDETDKVSTRGYAMGYLGGGILLAINVAMIQFLPGNWGPRISFLSVAIWWAVFSIPLFRRIPEPPSAAAVLEKGQSVIGKSFERLKETLKDIKRYKELFKYLVSFLIYNDGIGTIIGVSIIYGAELGFGTIELVLALLMVQFVGIPFSLIFGSIPSGKGKNRAKFLAFVIFNLIAIPILGVSSLLILPVDISGAVPEPLTVPSGSYGEGTYAVADLDVLTGWSVETIDGDILKPTGLTGFLSDPFSGEPQDEVYMQAEGEQATMLIPISGDNFKLTYQKGPDHGIWTVKVYEAVDGHRGDLVWEEPEEIDAYNSADRYGVSTKFSVEESGNYIVEISGTGNSNPDSAGNTIAINAIEVLPLARNNNLGIILGLILGLQLVLILLAWLLGDKLFMNLANSMTTKRGIILALIIYSAIAVWGFFLNSTIEFWCLAWMVAVVQGGSQALSRSLYSSMSPASKSGEFFGLFGVMEKFSAIVGPLLFAFAALMFNNSRPAILSLIVLFVLGIYLLGKVDVEAGRKVAREEDAEYFDKNNF